MRRMYSNLLWGAHREKNGQDVTHTEGERVSSLPADQPPAPPWPAAAGCSSLGLGQGGAAAVDAVRCCGARIVCLLQHCHSVLAAAGGGWGAQQGGRGWGARPGGELGGTPQAEALPTRGQAWLDERSGQLPGRLPHWRYPSPCNQRSLGPEVADDEQPACNGRITGSEWTRRRRLGRRAHVAHVPVAAPCSPAGVCLWPQAQAAAGPTPIAATVRPPLFRYAGRGMVASHSFRPLFRVQVYCRGAGPGRQGIVHPVCRLPGNATRLSPSSAGKPTAPRMGPDRKRRRRSAHSGTTGGRRWGCGCGGETTEWPGGAAGEQRQGAQRRWRLAHGLPGSDRVPVRTRVPSAGHTPPPVDERTAGISCHRAQPARPRLTRPAVRRG